MRRSTVKQHLLVITLCLGSSLARGSNEDVNDAIFERMQTSDAQLVDRIYRKAFGEDRPARMQAEGLDFEGSVSSEGIQFNNYNAVPAKPLVVKDSTLFNCNDRETSQNIGVSKTSSNTHTWSNTNGWTNGNKVTVSAGWEFAAKTPVGEVKKSVSASAESYGEVSGSKTEEHSVSETLQWNDSAGIPVGKHASVRVQYVVQEEKRDVPYHVNFVARGKTSLTYRSNEPGWYWADWRGTGDNYNGKVMVADDYPVCSRNYGGGKILIGKVDGAYCRIGWGSGKNPPERWKLSHKSHDVKVLTANTDTFAWVKADVTQRPINAVQRKGAYVCAVEVKGKLHPGYNNKGRDDCVISFGKPENNKTQRHYEFSYLVGGETKIATFNLQEHLKGVEDRTFVVHGVYKGVVAVDSQFRVDAPIPLETCGNDGTVHEEDHSNPQKTQALTPAKTMMGKRPQKQAS